MQCAMRWGYGVPCSVLCVKIWTMLFTILARLCGQKLAIAHLQSTVTSSVDRSIAYDIACSHCPSTRGTPFSSGDSSQLPFNIIGVHVKVPIANTYGYLPTLYCLQYSKYFYIFCFNITNLRYTNQFPLRNEHK